MKKTKFKDLIVYEDDDFIGINKPPYISTLSDRNDVSNILALAREYFEESMVCHRLDKETSGILILAKNKEAYRHMAMQLEARTVDKVYHAVADGLHEFNNIMVDAPLHDFGKDIIRINRSRGKQAQTTFNSLRAYKRHTLIECKPLTGRRHQIRVHLQSLKASIAGDEIYDGQPVYLSTLKKKFNIGKYEEEPPIMRRTALHAFAISFKGLDDQQINIEAQYPKDFAVLIKQLEKNR